MNQTITKKIKELSKEIYPQLVKLRRELHQYPEIAFQEFKTSERIVQELKKLNLSVRTKVGRTGVVGLLTGVKKGKTVALRSDMDALPVTEQINFPYKSKNLGKMHACGHDVNMAVVIGAATILNRLRSELNGNVKFIFQPSEEVTPGGAVEMIKEGVLENPKVEGIFASHVDAHIPVGKIGVKDLAMMAQADDFDLIIYGKGGHGARPHEGVDAIVVSAQIIQALQTIVSRRISPLKPIVISIGIINGGTASNIICDKVFMEGTARTLDKEVTKKIPGLLKEVVSGIAKSAGAKVEVKYYEGYPILINRPEMNDYFRRAFKKLYNMKSIEIKEPMMGGEDFARYLQKIPGAMMRLGIRNEKIGAIYPWHHPKFSVDENAIKMGAEIFAQVCFDFLNQ
jgi:amidohydrolase